MCLCVCIDEAGGARLEFVENLRGYSSLLRTAPAIVDKRVSVNSAIDVVLLSDVVKEMALFMDLRLLCR